MKSNKVKKHFLTTFALLIAISWSNTSFAQPTLKGLVKGTDKIVKKKKDTEKDIKKLDKNTKEITDDIPKGSGNSKTSKDSKTTTTKNENSSDEKSETTNTINSSNEAVVSGSCDICPYIKSETSNPARMYYPKVVAGCEKASEFFGLSEAQLKSEYLSSPDPNFGSETSHLNKIESSYNFDADKLLMNFNRDLKKLEDKNTNSKCDVNSYRDRYDSYVKKKEENIEYLLSLAKSDHKNASNKAKIDNEQQQSAQDERRFFVKNITTPDRWENDLWKLSRQDEYAGHMEKIKSEHQSITAKIKETASIPDEYTYRDKAVIRMQEFDAKYGGGSYASNFFKEEKNDKSWVLTNLSSATGDQLMDALKSFKRVKNIADTWLSIYPESTWANYAKKAEYHMGQISGEVSNRSAGLMTGPFHKQMIEAGTNLVLSRKKFTVSNPGTADIVKEGETVSLGDELYFGVFHPFALGDDKKKNLDVKLVVFEDPNDPEGTTLGSVSYIKGWGAAPGFRLYDDQQDKAAYTHDLLGGNWTSYDPEKDAERMADNFIMKVFEDAEGLIPGVYPAEIRLDEFGHKCKFNLEIKTADIENFKKNLLPKMVQGKINCIRVPSKNASGQAKYAAAIKKEVLGSSNFKEVKLVAVNTDEMVVKDEWTSIPKHKFVRAYVVAITNDGVPQLKSLTAGRNYEGSGKYGSIYVNGAKAEGREFNLKYLNAKYEDEYKSTSFRRTDK